MLESYKTNPCFTTRLRGNATFSILKSRLPLKKEKEEKCMKNTLVLD
jgi:hypothetical protein